MQYSCTIQQFIKSSYCPSSPQFRFRLKTTKRISWHLSGVNEIRVPLKQNQYCISARSGKVRTHCVSVRSKNACLSRSRLTSSSVHPFLAFNSSMTFRFFLFKRRLMNRSKKQINIWEESKTRMEIFPGMKSGASLG